jgi:hypothetical protein
MKILRLSAAVATVWLLFNMVAMAFWWGGFSASGGFRGGVQLVILAGFAFILLLDLVSTGWVLTRVCWIRVGKVEEGCQRGWLLVLAVLALVGMMGAKVMVDEIARETPLGGVGGEWGILYICLGLQLAYLVALGSQKAGSSTSTGS